MITMITTLSHIHSPAPNDFVGGCFMCPDSLEVVSCAQSRGRGTEGEGGAGRLQASDPTELCTQHVKVSCFREGGGAASGARGRGGGGGFGGEGGDCQGCRVLALGLRVLIFPQILHASLAQGSVPTAASSPDGRSMPIEDCIQILHASLAQGSVPTAASSPDGRSMPIEDCIVGEW